MATLIMIAKLNDVDPQAWLADVRACIAGYPAQRLAELLPLEVAAAGLRLHRDQPRGPDLAADAQPRLRADAYGAPAGLS